MKKIALYCLSFFFFLVGFATVNNGRWMFVVSLTLGIILFPPIRNFLKSKFDKKNQFKKLTIALCVVWFFIFISFAGNNNSTNQTSSKKGSILYNALNNSESEKPENAPAAVEEYVSTNYSEFHQKFGINSDLTDMQKDSIFDQQFKNKKVKWSGRVVEISEGLLGGINITLKQSSDSLQSDVTLELPDEQKNSVLQVRKGQRITYEGRLSSWGNLIDTIVSDGKILEM